jgi:hypothetical protein
MTGTQPVTQDPEVMLEIPRRLVEDGNEKTRHISIPMKRLLPISLESSRLERHCPLKAAKNTSVRYRIGMSVVHR